jgi:hypothetical protein
MHAAIVAEMYSIEIESEQNIHESWRFHETRIDWVQWILEENKNAQ